MTDVLLYRMCNICFAALFSQLKSCFKVLLKIRIWMIVFGEWALHFKETIMRQVRASLDGGMNWKDFTQPSHMYCVIKCVISHGNQSLGSQTNIDQSLHLNNMTGTNCHSTVDNIAFLEASWRLKRLWSDCRYVGICNLTEFRIL